LEVNLSSPGVKGGVLIVVGEDYGEGASVIQERTHAYAMKSTMCLLDPRPHLPTMVNMVEHGFAMSEASNMPCIMELRIRACHVRGSFTAKTNLSPKVSTKALMAAPARFDYSKLAHPPVTFPQEKLKFIERVPAARQYIVEHGLNEVFTAQRFSALNKLGLIVQGGVYNALMRALMQLGLADAQGHSPINLLVLNVTYPLVPEQILDFCNQQQSVLLIEEGQPEYIEHEIATQLRRQESPCKLHGKDIVPMAGEMSVEVLARSVLTWIENYPELLEQVDREQAQQLSTGQEWLARNNKRRDSLKGDPVMSHLPPRPPSFCVGCPERPVFSALQLAQQDVGKVHIAADIGCHALGTFEPFNTGHSILGYGMSLASRAGVSPMMQRRSVALMGDGGFWHNGLLTGVQSALFNREDAVLIIFKNGYTSATGTQDIISTPENDAKYNAADKAQSLAHTDQTIENTLNGLGVKWMRTVHTYRVSQMRKTISEALTTEFNGLKVIIAEGECQLERQRRIKAWIDELLKKGQRVERVRYGVDSEVCNGDHACIRLSGCSTLTLVDNPDPFKLDPIAKVIDGCVGCGLCGENAHAATLCPSFYRAEIVKNPRFGERLMHRIRSALAPILQTKHSAHRAH
jgi:indolepyruvate ferredoxin oxidoreductase, alpha subunit